MGDQDYPPAQPEAQRPKMSRDEQAWANVKFEQIPLFWAAQLQGMVPIATLESCLLPLEQIISGSAPGRGPQGMGDCSRCYEAQANLKVKP